MADMLASLPWYDLNELSAATDALWQTLDLHLRRQGLEDVPQQLNRAIPYEKQWTSRRLLLGQACGYDVLIAYAKELRMVATPRYNAPGCLGSTYCSFVVVRDDSP